MKRLIYMAAATSILAGCATQGTDDAARMAATPASATEMLRDASGRAVGTATITQAGDSLRVRIEGTALPPGAHAAHVHAVGLCTPPTFDSAGPHWNPTGRQHGKNNPAGMHKGDLPNLTADTAGRVTLEHTITDARMTGAAAALLNGDGAAVVIHANADDYRTDPSGNSGGRIACAAFR
jgi:superoxide dismutase, Cu-Zn family